MRTHTQERKLWRDPFWTGKRKPFIIAIVAAGISVILLFLSNMSYLYGSLYKDTFKAKALNVLAIDYDGGLIGEALSAAYSELATDSFPTLQFHTVPDYPTVKDVQHAVCKGHFWAAIFSHPGASTRLEAALTGGPAAADYNSSNTLTFVWNEVHYPTVQEGFIQSSLITLIGAAGAAYSSINGTGAVSVLNTTDRNAVLALLNPIEASNINLNPTSQGPRVLYNTVTMVLPIIQQFFFLMAINGIHNQFGIFGHLRASRVGIIRLAMALCYTFLGSLATIGYIWAFREDWGVNGSQFVLSWMTMWIYMHINFAVLDAATAYVPLSFLSFFVLTWAIINVTTTIFPFQLSAGWYRVGYALPAHPTISILWQVWSGGCNNQLYWALPVLFVWEAVAIPLAISGSVRRNNKARQEILDLQNKPVEIEMEGGGGRYNRSESRLVEYENMERSAGPGLPIPFGDRIYNPKLLKQLSRQTTI